MSQSRMSLKIIKITSPEIIPNYCVAQEGIFCEKSGLFFFSQNIPLILCPGGHIMSVRLPGIWGSFQ